MSLRILQIMPAEGWRAVYEIDARSTTGALGGWALVEVDDRRFITGFAPDRLGGVVLVLDDPYCTGYVYRQSVAP